MISFVFFGFEEMWRGGGRRGRGGREGAEGDEVMCRSFAELFMEKFAGVLVKTLL
jgi:hypothetical protein